MRNQFLLPPTHYISSRCRSIYNSSSSSNRRNCKYRCNKLLKLRRCSSKFKWQPRSNFRCSILLSSISKLTKPASLTNIRWWKGNSRSWRDKILTIAYHWRHQIIWRCRLQIKDFTARLHQLCHSLRDWIQTTRLLLSYRSQLRLSLSSAWTSMTKWGCQRTILQPSSRTFRLRTSCINQWPDFSLWRWVKKRVQALLSDRSHPKSMFSQHKLSLEWQVQKHLQ